MLLRRSSRRVYGIVATRSHSTSQRLIAKLLIAGSTPSFLLRGTSYISCLTRKGKDHFFRPSLARALPVAAQCCHSIPPCAPVPALSSCDAETALPDRPSMSKRAFSAAATAAAADRHSTHPPPAAACAVGASIICMWKRYRTASCCDFSIISSNMSNDSRLYSTSGSCCP